MTEQQEKQQKLIEYLENTSPVCLLEDISCGTVADVDKRLVSELTHKFKLNQGVMNVILYVVLLKTDMKLTRAFLEKICGHYTRKGITTVPEAMETAKREYRKYQTWQSAHQPVKKQEEDEWNQFMDRIEKKIITKLMQRVEQLEFRVKELEDRLSAKN